jgi:predicted permease
VWRGIFGRRRREEELDEEIQTHIAITTKHLADDGLSAGDAAAEARRTFGNRALAAELTRESWGAAWIWSAWQDLRYAGRSLRRSPGFTTAVVLSLALGIGAATVVFSVADTIYLRPLPYPAQQDLMFVAVRMLGSEFVMSPDYVAWRRDNSAFAEFAAMQLHGGSVAILGANDPVEVHTTRVSYNFVTALGVQLAKGRNFQLQDEPPNAPRTAILTESVWRRHFRTRSDIVGENITLDGQPYRVVGVLPPSFVMPLEAPAEILTTLPVLPTLSHHDRGMATWTVIGRLKPGVTQAQAMANLEALFAASKADAPQIFRNDTSVMMEPLQQRMTGNARALVLVLAGAVGCVLLIACANVANLLLARWSARSRELAVRAAIGAGRPRLVRQLLTETAVLAAAGCALGIVLVVAGLRGLVYFAAGALPRLNEVTADGRVFGIAIAVSVATILLFGVLPALRAGRVDVQTALQRAGRAGMSGGYRVARRALVAVEVALSVVLLSGAALLLETLWRMQHDRLGFEPEQVISISVPLRGAKVENANRRALTMEVLDEIRRLPGTISASWTECTPLSGGSIGVTFTRSDRPQPKQWDRNQSVPSCAAGPEYFQAAGMVLIRGRAFSETEYDHPQTLAVINEALARRYFPGEDPIGHQIDWRTATGWKTVIGIVRDSKNQGLSQPAIPQMFANDVALYSASNMMFVVRHVGSEPMLVAAVRAKLRAIDPGMLAKFETLDEAIGRLSVKPRFNGVLVGSFAAVAFLMAVIGVYGVLAFAVAQRTREIGVRIALGAEPKRVQGMVLREGLVLTGAGTLAGLAGSLVAGGYLKTLLYEISATDLRTYVAVVATIGVSAMFAAWIPARRAARVEPVVALRQE